MMAMIGLFGLLCLAYVIYDDVFNKDAYIKKLEREGKY